MKNRLFVMTLLMVMLFGLPMMQRPTTGATLSAKCVKTTGKNVRLRYGPGEGYGIYCQLPKGTVMTYLGNSSDNNWYRVSYQGQELYISRDYSSLCDCGNSSYTPTVPRQKTQCVVHAKHVRLRTGPDANRYPYFIWEETGKPIYFNKGDVLEYLGEHENGFYKVRYRGYVAWICSDYCTLR